MAQTDIEAGADQSAAARAAATIAAGAKVVRNEADALSLLAQSLNADFAAAVDKFFNASGRVICAGVGKSGHVARKIAATFASTGTPAYFVHPTEASHGDLGMITPDDVVLALSRSGETRELGDLIQYSRRHGVGLIGMTARADSGLARSSDIVVLVPDVEEACAETRAPTTSTTLMMALGDALAVALLERRGFSAADFKTFHPGGKLGAALMTARDVMHEGADLPLVREGDALSAALEMISAKSFGCVGVLSDAGALAGIITDGDVRRILVSGAQPSTAGAAMSTNPITASEGDLAASILNTMNQRKITQIFVVRDGAPVGLVHMHDLLVIGAA